jgi:hypothetical protein
MIETTPTAMVSTETLSGDAFSENPCSQGLLLAAAAPAKFAACGEFLDWANFAGR